MGGGEGGCCFEETGSGVGAERDAFLDDFVKCGILLCMFC